MIRIFTVLFIAFLGVNLWAQNGFIKYVDLQNRFEVEVPGYFKYDTKTFNTQAGSVTSENFSLKKEGNHPNSLYLVNTVYYTQGYFNQDSVDFLNEYLENNVINTADMYGCDIVYSTQGSLSKGTPMINFRLEGKSSDKIIKGAFYIKDNTVFGIQVFTTLKSSLNPSIDKFLTSFVLEKDIPDMEILQVVKKKKQSALKKVN